MWIIYDPVNTEVGDNLLFLEMKCTAKREEQSSALQLMVRLCRLIGPEGQLVLWEAAFQFFESHHSNQKNNYTINVLKVSEYYLPLWDTS